jgi:hypothetical protein
VSKSNKRDPEFIALGSVVRDLLHPDMLLIDGPRGSAGGAAR